MLFTVLGDTLVEETMKIDREGMEVLSKLPGTLYVSKPYGQETEYGLGFEQCEKLYSEKLKAILDRFTIQE